MLLVIESYNGIQIGKVTGGGCRCRKDRREYNCRTIWSTCDDGLEDVIIVEASMRVGLLC